MVYHTITMGYAASRPRLNQAWIVYICSIEPQTQSGLALLLLLSVDVDIGLNQAWRCCCCSHRFYRQTDYIILYPIICY